MVKRKDLNIGAHYGKRGNVTAPVIKGPVPRSLTARRDHLWIGGTGKVLFKGEIPSGAELAVIGQSKDYAERNRLLIQTSLLKLDKDVDIAIAIDIGINARTNPNACGNRFFS